MKTILVNRIKKWMIFALVGSVAYLVGYSMGHQNLAAKKTTEPPTLMAPTTSE